jgi:DNA end-binding protein Ku
MTVDFDPDEYHDHYREALQELVDAKVEGREIVQPEGPSEPAELTSLADALKASLAAAQGAPREAGQVTAAASPRAIDDGAKKSRAAAKDGAAKSARTRRAKSDEGETGEAASGGTTGARTKAGTSKPAAAKEGQRPAAKRSAKGATADGAPTSKTRRRAS